MLDMYRKECFSQPFVNIYFDLGLCSLPSCTSRGSLGTGVKKPIPVWLQEYPIPNLTHEISLELLNHV